MRKKDCRSLMTTMFTVAAMLVFTAPGIILGAEAVGFEDVESDMAASDKAFGLGDGGANSALEEADNAFAVDAPTQVSAEVGTPKKQKNHAGLYVGVSKDKLWFCSTKSSGYHVL